MGAFCESLWLFLRGVLSRSYYWLFALLLDPTDAYNRFRPADWPRYDVSLEAFFAVLAGLILWTALLTFHDLRVRTNEEIQEPTMPLYLACRWIARDSVWAAKFDPTHDSKWVSLVDEELMGKVLRSRVELFGKRQRRGHPKEPMQQVISTAKSEVEWESSRLATAEPPTHMWQRGGDSYYDVHLDEARVKQLWPRRSLWAWFRKRSPVERLGGRDYRGLFAAQDAYYRNVEPMVTDVVAALSERQRNG